MINKILEIIEREGEFIYPQSRISLELCLYMYIEEDIETEIMSTNECIRMYKKEGKDEFYN